MLGRVYIFKYLRSKWLALFGVLLLSFSVFASNGKTTYQAKIVKPDGYPLEAANVTFKFTVLDTVGACVLYSELYSAVDMRSTGGLISFALGNGVRDFPASGTTAVFAKVFDNSITSMPCQAPGIYNPGPNDTRKIVMQFNDGTGWQTLPAMTINSVPYAMYADQASNAKALNGKADSDFVEVSTLAGLNCGVNQAIKFNNATFSCIDVPASGSGGISSVTTSGSVLVTGGTASAPVISIQAATLSQDGYLTSLDYAEFKAKLSASATQIINTLGFTPVSSSTVASQIASSTLAGDVSGTPGNNIVSSVGGKTAAQVSASVDDTSAATASATAGTLVKRDISGNATLNDLYASAVKINYVDIYKPTTSFNVRLQAPTSLNASYVLNLPTTSGTAGQVLSTDGAGNLSWINPSTGSVVSVSATAPLASTGGTTPTISISQATSGTDGYLSSADWNTFNNKQQATSAAIMATLGYEPVASGSVVSSQWVSSGTDISYEQGFVGIGLSDPAHNLSVSGTAFFSGVATVSGSLNGAVVLPGGNVNQNPVIFRFDQNVLAYADKWATVTTTPVFNAQKLFNINDGGVNLYDVNAGADVVIEVTGVSIGNTSHNNMWPFVAFHSNPTGNVKLEVMSSSLAWETAYEGPTAAYVLKKFSMSAGGLRGARYTFSAMSPGTWLKTVGVIGRNSTPYQWVLRRDGGTVYGDINLLAKLGVGISSPSARLQIASGSTSIAPLKINSGTLLSSAQAGAIEYDGVNFYLTDDTNTRRSIATVASPGSFDNANTISNTAGNITLSPNNTTGSVVVSATTASTNANTGALVVKGGVGVSGNLNVSGTMATSNIVTSIINGTTDLLLNPSGGNVGVGVSSPTSRLDVGGDINMANNSVLRSGGRQLLIMGLSGTTYLDSNGPGSGIRLQPNGNVAMTLTASGNVGIGTTTPGAKLSVEGSASTSNKLLEVKSAGVAAGNAVPFYGAYIDVGANNSTTDFYGVYSRLNYQGGSDRSYAGYFSNNGDPTSPTWGLFAETTQVDTNGPAEATAGEFLVKTNSPGNLGSTIGLKITNAASSGSVATGLSIATASGATTVIPLRISHNSNDIFRITATGNVGIGTTNPGAKLHVLDKGSGELTLARFMASTADESDNQHLKITASAVSDTVYLDSTGMTGGAIQFRRGGTDTMIIDTSSNVGIGTTSPLTKLHVAGDIYRTWDTFYVPNDNLTYYPVVLSVTNNIQREFDFEITHGVHEDFGSSGSLVFNIKGTLSGYGGGYRNYDYTISQNTFGFPKRALDEVYFDPYGSNIVLYLLGGRTYHIRNRTAGTRFVEARTTALSVCYNACAVTFDTPAPYTTTTGSFNVALAESTTRNFGIGTGNPGAKITVADATSNQEQLLQFSTDANPARTIYRKARGSLSSATSVVTGDVVGDLMFQATPDGTNYRTSAQISAGVGSGTISGASMPGYLSFSTTPDGTVTTTERMRINALGNVGIGTSSPEVKLHVMGITRIGADTTSYMNFDVAKDITALNPGTTTPVGSVIEGAISRSLILDLKNNNPDDAFAIRYSSSNNNVVDAIGFVMRGNGNVGIGTTAPGQKLTVSGVVQSTSGGFRFPDGTTQTTAAISGQMQRGRIGNCSASNAGSTGSVTFATAFSATPIISLTPVELDDTGCTSVRVIAHSATGFTWKAFTGGTVTACDCINWTALEP